MAEPEAKPGGSDLSQGVAVAELADGGMLLGHVGEDQVLVARRGAEVFAVSAGPIRIAGKPFASSTGWSPSARGRSPG